ncbi:MAG: hypothetical protein IKB16_04985 [Lentisphaeria bacterium]|nr:hypothetical protein [Lentisphaeria bacterium]
MKLFILIVEVSKQVLQDMKLFILILAGFTVSSVFGLGFKNGDREAVLETARLRAIVRDGRIIHLENRKTGKIYADRRLNEKSMTAGLGYMFGKEKELSKLHFPWGEPRMMQHVEIRKTQLYRYPDDKSHYSAKKIGDRVIVSWKGLTDGKNFFAKDELTITFQEDSSGALVYQGKGSSPEKGVFAVQIPLENIVRESTFLLPTFGGLEYKGKGRAALMMFHSSIMFYEAPVMICTVGSDSLSMWSEDARFRTFFAFFTRNKKSCSFALEFLNLIPYEQHNHSLSNPVKLDVFEDSDWIAAARPYRNWYHKTFAKEIAQRDSGWAEEISVISDTTTGNKKVLEKVASMMPPNRVLFHVWQARRDGFTANVPDYTPKADYPKQVALYHSYGFKVMCYVCALCVTYGKELWNRDDLGNIVLPRRTSVTSYNASHSAFDENLVGNIVKSEKGKDPFGALKKGQLIYTDPLAPGWRKYYSDTIHKFNRLTGTDANYQDTLGVADDVGNGIIDGLSGAEGNAALARVLQKKVGVPMAAEFGPAPIAFAIKWPLNYAQVWGSDSFRKSRFHRHRPLTAFLFGYRQWVPTIVAANDTKKHLIASVADAISGMGMFQASANMQNKEGFDGHLVLRSQIYAQNGLKPYYPEKKYPVNVKAMYKGMNDGIFQYWDDGKLQMLLSPDGKPLYGRADGVTEIKRSDLVYPNWPVWDENGIYSLDPDQSYALFPVGTSARPELRIAPLEQGTTLRFFYETEDFTYLEINKNRKSKKTESSVIVTVPERFTQVICNDVYSVVKPGKQLFRGKLPLRLVFSNGKTTSPSTIRKINMAAGLPIGDPEPLNAGRKIAGKTLYSINYFNAKSVDYMAEVKEKNAALELYFQNFQKKYGNGSSVELLINGKRQAFFDCLQPNPKWKKGAKIPRMLFDTQLRKWTIPVGRYVGKKILVSLRVSDKNSTNADQQFVSMPAFVRNSAQVFKEEIVKVQPPPPKSAVYPRPSGKAIAVSMPGWNQKAVTASGDRTVFSYNPIASHGVLYGAEKIKIDPSKRYYLSADIKAENNNNSVIIGIVQYNAMGQEIHGVHINPVQNSLTRLSHPARRNSKRIQVMDASAWLPGNMVAFHASPDRKDLPNRMLAGPVEAIHKGGGDWTVDLKTPLKFDIAPDSYVRQHRPMGTHSYMYSGSAGKDWKPIGKEIKFWKGAVAFRCVIISRKPFQFKNMKLEIYQN